MRERDEYPSSLGTSIYRSLAVSTLLEFYKKHKIPVSELEKTEGEFEQTGTRGPYSLWTPRIAVTDAEVIHRNIVLMIFVWHFQDFFWEYGHTALNLTKKDCQTATRLAIQNSKALKVCGYFANKEKHGTLTDFKRYPAFEKNPPSLGKVVVDFFSEGGKIAYMTDLEGALGHQCSTALDFAQSVDIENFEPEWDTRMAAEEAAWEWINLLHAHGQDLGVRRPVVSEEPVKIDFIGIGTSPHAFESRQFKLPDWLQAPPVSWDDFETPVTVSGLLSIPAEWHSLEFEP